MYEAATRKEIPLLATMRELLMLGPASTPATRRRGATTATGTTTTAAVAATGAPTPEQQQRVDLVRGMTPYQRCEYLANFLRTQVRSIVSFRIHSFSVV